MMAMKAAMKVVKKVATKVTTKAMLKSVKIQTSIQMEVSLQTETVMIARITLGTQAGVEDMMMKTSPQIKCAALVEVAVQ